MRVKELFQFKKYYKNISAKEIFLLVFYIATSIAAYVLFFKFTMNAYWIAPLAKSFLLAFFMGILMETYALLLRRTVKNPGYSPFFQPRGPLFRRVLLVAAGALIFASVATGIILLSNNLYLFK